MEGFRERKWTNFDAGDAKATGSENDADAAGSDSFSETTHHTSGH